MTLFESALYLLLAALYFVSGERMDKEWRAYWEEKRSQQMKQIAEKLRDPAFRESMRRLREQCS